MVDRPFHRQRISKFALGHLESQPRLDQHHRRGRDVAASFHLIAPAEGRNLIVIITKLTGTCGVSSLCALVTHPGVCDGESEVVSLRFQPERDFPKRAKKQRHGADILVHLSVAVCMLESPEIKPILLPRMYK
jgi:hypothetical protein